MTAGNGHVGEWRDRGDPSTKRAVVVVRLIIRAFFSLIFAAVIGSIVIFLMMHFLGGDVVTVILGKEAGPADVSAMRRFGLDRPLFHRAVLLVAQGSVLR